ncbi:MAG: hypothetical protein ACRDTI_09410 [Mycobacterium sp.]
MAEEPPSVEQLETAGSQIKAYKPEQIVVEMSQSDINKWSGIATAALEQLAASASGTHRCDIGSPGAGQPFESINATAAQLDESTEQIRAYIQNTHAAVLNLQELLNDALTAIMRQAGN